jgi:hypothetical protein
MWDDFLTLIVDILLWLPRMLYSLVADVIDYFMTFLPATGFDTQSALNGWSGDILYFLTIFQIPFAVSALFTALIARFILRRIPFIG